MRCSVSLEQLYILLRSAKCRRRVFCLAPNAIIYTWGPHYQHAASDAYACSSGSSGNEMLEELVVAVVAVVVVVMVMVVVAVAEAVVVAVAVAVAVAVVAVVVVVIKCSKN